MRVRPAVPADVLEDDALLDKVDDPSRIDTLRTYLAETVPDAPIIYLVAEDDSAIVGFLQLLYSERVPDHIDGDDAYLRSLYIHPDFWNNGIGTALLEDGLDRLSDELGGVHLGVLAANDIGKRFYETHGFERIDSGTFEVGSVTDDTDIYTKPL